MNEFSAIDPRIVRGVRNYLQDTGRDISDLGFVTRVVEKERVKETIGEKIKTETNPKVQLCVTWPLPTSSSARLVSGKNSPYGRLPQHHWPLNAEEVLGQRGSLYIKRADSVVPVARLTNAAWDLFSLGVDLPRPTKKTAILAKASGENAKELCLPFDCLRFLPVIDHIGQIERTNLPEWLWPYLQIRFAMDANMVPANTHQRFGGVPHQDTAGKLAAPLGDNPSLPPLSNNFYILFSDASTIFYEAIDYAFAGSPAIRSVNKPITFDPGTFLKFSGQSWHRTGRKHVPMFRNFSLGHGRIERNLLAKDVLKDPKLAVLVNQWLQRRADSSLRVPAMLEAPLPRYWMMEPRDVYDVRQARLATLAC